MLLPLLLRVLVFHPVVWAQRLGPLPAVQVLRLQALVVEPALIKLQLHFWEGCLLADRSCLIQVLAALNAGCEVALNWSCCAHGVHVKFWAHEAGLLCDSCFALNIAIYYG